MGELLLPYLLLVFIHMLSGMQMEQPILLADELGYLGNARYLSGTGHLPDMRGCQFYHFGYSLILLPAFWIFTDPISTYKAAIAINALLISALYFPLYSILTSFLDLPRSTSRWIALTCCLYPSLVLYSNFAWSESAYVLFYVLVAALFGKLLRSRSSRHALLFGFLAGFLYTIHPRALPVLGIVLVYLLALVLLEVLPRRQALLSASTMGLVFAVTRLVNAHLKATGWGGGGEFSATKLAGRLLPGKEFATLIERALGQLLYLSQASHGLFLVGLAAVIWLILRNTASGSLRRVMGEPRTGVPIFVLITAGGVFLASCTTKLHSLHGPDGIRGADFIHGRYNEAFAVLLIAFALAEYVRNGLSRRQLALLVAGVIATILCLTAVVTLEINDALSKRVPPAPGAVLEDRVRSSDVDAIDVPGVYPLVGVLEALNLSFMSLAAIVAFLTITMVMRVSQRGGMTLLSLLFLSFAFYNHQHYLLPAKAMVSPRLAFAAEMNRLGPIGAVSYDVAYHEPEVLYGIQYLLPRVVLNRFDSREGERPASEAVISGNGWADARRLGAQFVLSSGWDNALWVLPGEMQSRLPSASYEGVTLGPAPVFGVRESGFHLPETFLGLPGRWTDGAATLRVRLDPRHPPRLLGIETIVPGRDGARLQVLANGTELWHERVPSGAWSKTFRLEQVPLDDELLIELKSDASLSGERRLGVVVRGIRVTARDGPAYEGVTLGAENVLGVEESGFHLPERIEGAPGRWTTGAASLRVPLDPRNPPRTLEIEMVAPLREGVDVQVLANGIELWRGRVPPEPWSKTLGLEQVPLNDDLLLELKSDTLTPAERRWRSRDERELGVGVRGIRLTAGGSLEDQGGRRDDVE